MRRLAGTSEAPGTVELQLLRHGPSHNQLLSPLTEYFALCGDHSNATLRVPLEHQALLTRLRALRYGDSEQTRVDQLAELSRIASELLAQVPGLIAELSSHHAGGKPFVHLSIASRASELALFPFELALAPDGFPGAGQPALLQQHLPICLTRRSKNVRSDGVDWDRPVKILLVASEAGGEIPLQRHYALLRKLAQPWVATRETDSAETKQRKCQKVLRLLANASIPAIEHALREELDQTNEPFTHVHILAHGGELPHDKERFGVALHHATAGERDLVDGKRLAKVLGCRPGYPATSRRYAGPAVVTLAVCDSAGLVDVRTPGGSVAFELHDSGIPLVLGSQFPLSVEGSLIMTEALYRGFLAGRDPRSIIWEARRALLTNLSELPAFGSATLRAAHDWASFTAYAAFPDNLDEVLPNHRRSRQRLRMDAQLHNMDRYFQELSSGLSATAPSPQPLHWLSDLPSMLGRTAESVGKFEKWARHEGGTETPVRVTNLGILASAQKQMGLLYLRASVHRAPESRTDESLDAESDKARRAGEEWLAKSRETYWSIFAFSRNESWALTQAIVLNFALCGNYEDEHWNVARTLGHFEEFVPDAQRQVWALAVLVELEFLRWLRAEFEVEEPPEPEIAVGQLLSRIRDHYPDQPWDVRSAKRQFERYVSDFMKLALLKQKSPAPRGFEARYKHWRGTPSAAVERIREALQQLKDVELEPDE